MNLDHLYSFVCRGLLAEASLDKVGRQIDRRKREVG